MADGNELRVFLVEPNDKARYKTFIVYTNNEKSARQVVSTKINPMRQVQPGEPTALVDPVYTDEKSSRCMVLDVKVKQIFNTFKFSYQGFEYTVAKDFAVSLKVAKDI